MRSWQLQTLFGPFSFYVMGLSPDLEQALGETAQEITSTARGFQRLRHELAMASKYYGGEVAGRRFEWISIDFIRFWRRSTHSGGLSESEVDLLRGGGVDLGPERCCP